MSALVLASVTVVALAQVRTSQLQKPQKSQIADFASEASNSDAQLPNRSSSYQTGTPSSGDQFKNAMSPEEREALDTQSRHSHEAEQQARQLLKERRFKEAAKACHRALALSAKINNQPINRTALQLMGDIFQEQGHYQEAIDAYRKAPGNSRDSDIALCYLKIGDMKNARKFYNEEIFFGSKVDLPPAKKAIYMTSLPGTKTTKTMEASILFARGCKKESVAQLDEAVEDFKRVLVLVPRNALAARSIASDLGTLYLGEEATPYWARAAVFGTGDVAQEGMSRLKNVLTPPQVEQALSDARKITR